MKRLSFFVLLALMLGLYSMADNTSTGEPGYQGDGTTPSCVGQATNDHLFINGDVNFSSGDTQTVWFYLDDDEIYQNAKVQALTPIAYNKAGDLYNEITYNSFQCDIYLPEGVHLTSIQDEYGDEISYLYGDRMPSSANMVWSQKDSKIVDGKLYNVYQLLCYNTNAYGTHLSAKNASKYRNNGALKKEHTLFALYLHNDNQHLNEHRMDQDLIIANQIFGLRETSIAGWDTNSSLFFYGTGGNNKTQVYFRYCRAAIYGSKGYETPNSFSMPDTAVMHGGTVTIPVAMENNCAIAGFQTDMYLPQGFSVKKENGDYMVSLSGRKANDHIIMANEIENGVVRILSYSPSLKTYDGEDGDLFYITIQAPENGDGVYPILLKNTLLTNSNEEEITVNGTTCNLTVYPYILGDVNNSGSVTITDVVITARYILRYNPTPFVFGAADLNFDGNISITDVIKISRIVLETRTMYANRSSRETDSSVIMQGLAERGTDDSNTIALKIPRDNHSGEYTAFQLDIRLPEGVTATNFMLSGNNYSHILESEIIDDNTIRLLCYSPSIDAIDATGDTFLTFKAHGTVEDDQVITIDGIELVTMAGETVNPNSFVVAMTGKVSATEIEAKTFIGHRGQDIIIDSPVNQSVTITDLLGHTQVIDIQAGSNTIPVGGTGLYIVNVSGVTQKLMLR